MNSAEIVKLLAEEAGFDACIWLNGWIRISDPIRVTTIHVTTHGTTITYPIFTKCDFEDVDIDLKNPGSIEELKNYFASLKSTLEIIDKQSEKEFQEQYGKA